jgi:hypothetical protein
MTVEVMTSFKVRANGEEIILHPGQRVKFNDTIAERLISEGRVRKVQMYPVKIYSRLFNEEIYVVADQEEMEVLAAKGVKEVVYMAWEIPVLRGVGQERLKAIHQIKKIFPGTGLA